MPNLKKDYLKEDEVFNSMHARVGSIEEFAKRPVIGAYPKHVPKSLLAKGYYFEDSDDVIFASFDLQFDRVALSKKVDFGVDVGRFYADELERNRINGWRYGASLYYRHFVLRLGMNHYGRYSEFAPSLSYSNTYKKHSYTLQYTHQNAVFYTFKPRVIDEKITANHFAFSDDVSFKDKSSLWFSIEVNRYSNSDTELTAQFDWRFFNQTLRNSKISYDLALEGWYTMHSKPTDLYYSPHFADSTLLRIDPQYIYSNAIGLRGLFGVGYSFSDKNRPYKFGLTIFGNPTNALSYELGCLYDTSVRSVKNSNYHYEECTLSLGYTW